MNILDQSTSESQSITAPGRKWSAYQEAIFQSISDTQDNLLVQAVAGSGKTTTIIAGMAYAHGSSLFLAFNKSIAEEIRSRGPEGEVKTLNALGHSFWRANQPRAQLDMYKSQNILKNMLDSDLNKDYGYTLSRVLGAMKNNCMGLDGPVDIFDVEDLIDAMEFDIPAEMIQFFAEKLCLALSISQSMMDVFDFDDQLYMPLYCGWKFPVFSNVFVDECQDLSPIQHRMLGELYHLGARIVAVGDRHQAIYAFRGAMANSMDLLKGQFNMSELPLSVSYRCPLSVIREAQLLCPTILPRDGAPEGSVSKLEFDPNLFPSRQLVISRNNAPLFRAVLRHVRAKEPCRVLSNALESFSGFIRGFKVKQSSALMAKMENWYRIEVAAAKKKGFLGKLAGLEDRYLTIKLLCEEFPTVEEILALLKRLGQGNTGPIFSTIHKAKGMEADSVHIIRPDLLPSPWAKSEIQLAQENNLKYVAVTRAKNELIYGEEK